jgi:N-methylhydantoinase B
VKKPGENDFKPNYGFRTPLPADSVMSTLTGGGGGWGDPLKRETERVRHDVREELVSRESAERFYGVILREDLSIDEAATAARRATLEARRSQADLGGR